jgi:hypothetical protein
MDKKLLEAYNAKGWIPGPDETEEHFLKRVETLNHFFSYPPEEIDRFLTDTDWRGAREKTKELYGFIPDWMVGYYSNKNLSFFQGAATWISPKGDVNVPLIQLRKKFERGHLMRLYRKEEVLAHEAAHAARMQFEEPKFEEIFAYKSSPRPFRRFFGPLFERPWEANTFLVLLLIPLAVQIALYLNPSFDKFFLISYLPLAWIGVLFCRLLFLRFTLFLARKRVVPHMKEPSQSTCLLFRLTDSEIFRFAYQTKTEIDALMSKEKSLRWQLLREIYFKK